MAGSDLRLTSEIIPKCKCLNASKALTSTNKSWYSKPQFDQVNLDGWVRYLASILIPHYELCIPHSAIFGRLRSDRAAIRHSQFRFPEHDSAGKQSLGQAGRLGCFNPMKQVLKISQPIIHSKLQFDEIIPDGCNQYLVGFSTPTSEFCIPNSAISLPTCPNTSVGLKPKPWWKAWRVSESGVGMLGMTLTRQSYAQGSRVAIASRSEEHTSELQSQSTISYAVFCLKKKKKTNNKKQKKKNKKTTKNQKHWNHRQVSDV